MPTHKLPMLLKQVLSESFLCCLTINIPTMISSDWKICIAGGGKDGIGKTNEPEVHSSLPETHSSHKQASPTLPETEKTHKEPSTSLENENTQNLTRDSLAETEGKCTMATDPDPRTGNTSSGEPNSTNRASSNEKQKISSSATPHQLECNNPVVERSSLESQNE